MLCENCQSRDASVHVKRTHNNQVTEYNLCSACAQELDKGGQAALNDFFGGIFNSMFWGPSSFTYPKQQIQATESLKCPNCGLTERELLQKGVLGCPHCYQVFAHILNPVFQRVQGHTAQAEAEKIKISPEGFAVSTADETDQISQLRSEQQRASEAEDYEKAAQLRDEIKKLELAAKDDALAESEEALTENQAEADSDAEVDAASDSDAETDVDDEGEQEEEK